MRAKDRKTLFARLAWGMFDLITDMEKVEPKKTSRVSVTAPDVEALVVRWLSELNFLHTTKHRLFCRFEIRELDDRHLKAEVHGEDIDLRRHGVHTEIKAVTFHGLKVERENGVWTAQVLFDL